MTEPNIGKITGPPGCGKSTEIMRLILRACDKYFPNEIGAVSFTNAAVEEIRTRIARTVKIDKSVIKNVRTLHSHCFKLLGLSKTDVAESHMAEFNAEYPQYRISISSDDIPDEKDFMLDKKIRRNEVCFNEMQIMRNRLVPVKKWNLDTRIIYEKWSAWMKESKYIDFTGMLEQVLERELIPSIRILFVDEAQDLTPLQYAIIKKWSTNTVSTIYAGDSDQCIFRFSGSVPEAFIDLH
ncbi:MAG: UvrD-helicase domain-containing protein, partial [Deltaproteobacteria bacterium]|nr:UvrD-helicase domain-containing protein [Deltaproteobacteria bacterium]